MQKVLTIPVDRVKKLYECAAFYTDEHDVADVLGSIDDAGTLVDRDVAERDGSRCQIVACAIVRSRGNVLCLRRARNAGRPQLRLRYTVLVGGHVDEADCGESSVLAHCVKRELAEELGLDLGMQSRLLGVVADPTNLTGCLHLGIVFEVNIDGTEIELRSHHDTQEFVHAGKRRTVVLMSAAEIRGLSQTLDPWSRLVVGSRRFAQLVGVKPVAYHAQQFLGFS